jgi:RNA polymerase sigma factor (sigma-70 family)
MRYTPTDSDTQLIEGCRLRQPLAQKYLYERYFGRLVGTAYRYTSDKQTAFNIVNQAFLKIFGALDTYQDNNLLGWMRTIVFRTALNHIRDTVQFEDLSTVEYNLHNTPLSNEALAALDMEYILAAVRQLPDATRTVFSMYEIDGYSHAEIAEMLSISVGTSKWHLSEAKAKLRKILYKNHQTTFSTLSN